MGGHSAVLHISDQDALADLLGRLNSAVRRADMLNEIVRACKKSSELANAQLVVLQNKSQGNMVFRDASSDLPGVTWPEDNVVVIHECRVVHLPCIIGTSMLVDEMCELFEFMRAINGDINAVGSQKVPVKRIDLSNTQKTVCEYENKTPIFYAIEQKYVRVVKVLIDLGAQHDFGMVDAFSKSEKVTPVAYAMTLALKSYQREDGLFEIIDMLLEKADVNKFLDSARQDKSVLSVLVGFISLVGLDLEAQPGELIEAVKGEYMNIIELFLKGMRIFSNELDNFKQTQKFKGMLCSRLTNRRTASYQAPLTACGNLLTDEFRRYVESLPGTTRPSFLGKNVVFSAELGSVETQILSLAAYHGKIGLVQWLLANETVDINRSNGYGYAAIHFAAASNNVEIVKLLLSAGAVVQSRRMPYATVAQVAAINSSLSVIKFLNENYPEVLHQLDCSGQGILHYAASGRGNNVAVVKYIVESVKGINPEAKAGGDVMSDEEINQVLREFEEVRGCELSAGEREKFVECVRERSQDMGGCTPLYVAVESRNLSVAKYLVMRAKCNPDLKGPRGFTPLNLQTGAGTLLHSAVRSGDIEFVEALLGYSSADFKARVRGRTPMDLAICNRDRHMIDLLLKDPRQSITTEIGYREVPYARILSAKGLLSYKSRSVLMQRAKQSNLSKLKGIAIASTLFVVFMLSMVVSVLYSDKLLSLAVPVLQPVSVEVKLLLIAMLVLPVALACVIFYAHHITRQSEANSQERYNISVVPERTTRLRKYASDSGMSYTSRTSSDNVKDVSTSSCGVSVEPVENAYLADESDRECCYRRDTSRRASRGRRRAVEGLSIQEVVAVGEAYSRSSSLCTL